MASDSDPSTAELLDPRNEEGWEDVESDVEDHAFRSLFEDKWFGDVTEMLKHDKEKHGFNYVKIKRQLHLDSLDRVQLINFVRAEVKEGRPLPKIWTTSLFEDEQYLKPTMDEDAVLYSLDDINESAIDTDTPLDANEQEIQELRERVAQLHLQFTAYREEVNVQFQKRLKKMDNTPAADQPDSSQPSSTKPAPSSSQEDQDSGYFTSYSHNTIHESMLKDTIRTDAYRDFIYANKHLFAGKTILDVGCGTGILSLFCAKAGAKLVLAVDNSAIIDKARVIVYANGFQDVIKCLRGKIEDVTLPVPRVDVIISEWMGYGLLYESMLDSVLWARDRYLDPQVGLMVPSHATLRLAPLIDSELRISHVDFWSDVYGFDMRSMLSTVYDEALVRVIDKDDVAPASSSGPVLTLDLHTTQSSDLTFLHPFSLSWPATATANPPSLDGFALWFDIFFAPSRTTKLTTTESASLTQTAIHAFSTGPDAPQTHWQQVALLAKEVDRGFRPGEVLRGKIGYQKREGRGRSVEVEVVWGWGGGEGEKAEGEADGDGDGVGVGVGAGVSEGEGEKRDGEKADEEKGKEKKKSERRQVWVLD